MGQFVRYPRGVRLSIPLLVATRAHGPVRDEDVRADALPRDSSSDFLEPMMFVSLAHLLETKGDECLKLWCLVAGQPVPLLFRCDLSRESKRLADYRGA